MMLLLCLASLLAPARAANCADFDGENGACEASGCKYNWATGMCTEKFAATLINLGCVVHKNMALVDSKEDCELAAQSYGTTLTVASRPDLTTPMGCSTRDGENPLVWRASDLVWEDTEGYPDGYNKQWAIDQDLLLICKTQKDFPEFCTKFSDCKSCFEYNGRDEAWPTSCVFYTGEGCSDVYDQNNYKLVWRPSECPSEETAQYERNVAATLENQNKRLKTVNQALKKAFEAMGA